MQIRVVFLFLERGTHLQVGGYDTFIKGNVCSTFRQKGREQNILSVSATSQLPSAQDNPYAK